jgi:hypothetical protein
MGGRIFPLVEGGDKAPPENGSAQGGRRFPCRELTPFFMRGGGNSLDWKGVMEDKRNAEWGEVKERMFHQHFPRKIIERRKKL